MTQCVQRSVTQCLKRKLPLVSSQPRRLFSQGDAVNQDSPLSSSLVDLKAIHEKWKSAGFFPRYFKASPWLKFKCFTILLFPSEEIGSYQELFSE